MSWGKHQHAPCIRMLLAVERIGSCDIALPEIESLGRKHARLNGHGIVRHDFMQIAGAVKKCD